MEFLDVALWLMIAWVVLVWVSKCNCDCSEQDTLPVYQPQQHQPVYHPSPPSPSPSQSYRPTPNTPLLYQPEQRQPIPQPPPPSRRPPPARIHPSSSNTSLLYQPEQRQRVPQPPPPSRRPPPAQKHPSSSNTPLPPPGPPTYKVSQLPPQPPLQSHESSSHTPSSPLKYEDDDETEQENEDYADLRARANKEGDKMGRCFSESHEAYDRGDRAAAKDLSNQGKDHKQEMERLNREASSRIYLENNRGREPGEIDLHGLYVKEAITYTDTALEEAKLRGDSEVRFIVGKGLHSEGGIAKVRAAIEGLMRDHQLVAEFDPSNSGVLVVKLT